MSPLHAALYPRLASFPRVSGDEPPVWDQISSAVQFSPRERG